MSVDELETALEEQYGNRKKQAAIAAKQADLDFYEVMKSEIGRRVIWDLTGMYGAFMSSYSKDPIEMAFNEGMRNFSLRVMERLLRVCPELYIQAQSEAIARNKNLKGAA